MARYRVVSARVMTGVDLKASFVYELGEIVDEAMAPPGHVERLRAAGALSDPLPEDPPAPARRRAARD